MRRASVDIAGKLVDGTPKSHQMRTVPLPPSIATDLRPLVDGRDRDDLVFVSPEGTPLRVANFRRRVWMRAV